MQMSWKRDWARPCSFSFDFPGTFEASSFLFNESFLFISFVFCILHQWHLFFVANVFWNTNEDLLSIANHFADTIFMNFVRTWQNLASCESILKNTIYNFLLFIYVYYLSMSSINWGLGASLIYNIWSTRFSFYYKVEKDKNVYSRQQHIDLSRFVLQIFK